jgi:hypothetical protein
MVALDIQSNDKKKRTKIGIGIMLKIEILVVLN